MGLLHPQDEATSDTDDAAVRGTNPTSRGVCNLPTRDNDAGHQPGKWQGAVCIGEGWEANDEKTSVDQSPQRTGEAVKQQTKVDRSGRESTHMAGEMRQIAADDETSPFFPESVLHTEHAHVSQYAFPATGFLLAISRQAKTTDRPKANTYRKWVCLQGPRRESVWMHAVIDGRAMLNTLYASEWEKQKDWLTLLEPSDIILSVADNHRIPSEGTWTGVVDVAGTKVCKALKSSILMAHLKSY